MLQQLSKLENRLSGLFKLSSKVEIFIPSTVNVNEAIDNTKYVNYVASQLSTMFGGATAIPCNGYYMSDNKNIGLVKEATVCVYAYCDDNALNDNIDGIIGLCEKLKDSMKQECIGMTINSEMYFI